MCIIQKEKICKECKKKAHFVSGISILGDRYEQFYCDNCNNVFITKNGKYLRKGVLPEPLPREYPDVIEW